MSDIITILLLVLWMMFLVIYFTSLGFRYIQNIRLSYLYATNIG